MDLPTINNELTIIDSYDGLSLQAYPNDVYSIIFVTSASRFYCFNCEKTYTNKCRCNDYTWNNGLWNDCILLYKQDKTDSVNIFNFLKKNYDSISLLDRYKLSNWIKSSLDSFLLQYYSFDFKVIKLFIKFLYENNIFNYSFFNKIKNDIFEEFESLFVKYINLDFRDLDLDTIEYNIKESYQCDAEDDINNENDIIFNNIHTLIYIDKQISKLKFNDNISFNHVISYFYVFKNYLSLPPFKISFDNLLKQLSINEYFLNNGLDIDFSIDFIQKSFVSIIEKSESWLSMIDSPAFDFY